MPSRITRHALRQRGAVTTAIVLALVIAGTTLAAAPGDPLKLGMTNTINAATTWSGAATSRLLQISNTSTAAGARALSVLSNAAASTLYVQNTGNGSGIQIQVAAGKPPLTVNGAAGKATNLNADKLDGLDSLALQREATTSLSTDVDVTTAANDVEVDWVSWPFTQPAGRTLVGYVGEATATVPPTCAGLTAYVYVYLDGKFYGYQDVDWTAPTANTSVTLGLSFFGVDGQGFGAKPGQPSNVPHTLALKVVDSCTDPDNWTFTSAVFDVIMLG
jgi:hypothetical protein